MRITLNCTRTVCESAEFTAIAIFNAETLLAVRGQKDHFHSVGHFNDFM